MPKHTTPLEVFAVKIAKAVVRNPHYVRQAVLCVEERYANLNSRARAIAMTRNAVLDMQPSYVDIDHSLLKRCGKSVELDAFLRLSLRNQIKYKRWVQKNYVNVSRRTRFHAAVCLLDLQPAWLLRLCLAPSDMASIKSTSSSALDEKSRDVPVVHLSTINKAIEHAREILQENSTCGTGVVKELLWSVGLVTGRRAVEIMVTGRFSCNPGQDEYRVTERAPALAVSSAVFHGQAKRFRQPTGGNWWIFEDNEDPSAFVVPLLAPLRHVSDAMCTIRTLLKINPHTKSLRLAAVNTAHGHKCTAACKDAKQTLPFLTKFHELRSVYVYAVYYALRSEETRKSFHAHASDVLGHSGFSKTIHYMNIDVMDDLPLP